MKESLASENSEEPFAISNGDKIVGERVEYVDNCPTERWRICSRLCRVSECVGHITLVLDIV